ALCIVAQDVTERKQTEESLRRSLGVLLALREAGQILGSTLETEEIVTRLLTIMRGVSDLTAAVISVEDEPGQARIWRAVGLDGLWRRARYAPEAEEARRVVLEEGQHRLFRLQRPGAQPDQLAGLCLPLRMKDRIAGVLEAYGPESLTEDDTVEILRSLATQAASALENARLYGELAERERRLADLVGRLLTAQEEERRQVAYEVHDGLAQIAAAAHQHLQAFDNLYSPDSEQGRELLGQALELVQRTVREARRVIADLRPTALDDFGLRTALRLEAERLRSEGWRVGYESNLDDDERLPAAVETALFRVTQEALTNVRRHADSRRVRVTLDRVGDEVRLAVRDWGQGFDPSTPRPGEGPGERIGLHSMQERVALLGGQFHVESHLGAGTLITVEVPLTRSPAGGQSAEEIPTPRKANHVRSGSQEESQA
ncbi:MAG: GAF domain-containing sensor histidine kinase, partial [Rubrobacter sp.]